MWLVASIVVLVIILVALLVYAGVSSGKPKVAPAQRTSGCPPSGPCLPCGGDLSAARLQTPNLAQNASYDQQAYGALVENFETCGTASDTKNVADCVCGDGEGEFVKNEYGAPGMDYGSFVMSQAVDDQVIVNHANYVKNRKEFGTSGEYTGRTYSPDSHDSYDPIPWQGLRRPEYVNQCNPTQVPDVDTNLYKGNRSFCFKT